MQECKGKIKLNIIDGCNNRDIKNLTKIIILNFLSCINK